MRVRMQQAWRMAMVLWLAPAPVTAQATGETKVVRVRVFDVRTQAAIPEVELFALSGELLDHGDSAGVLRVRIKENSSFDGQLRRAGYVASSVRVTGRETGDSTVVLLAPLSGQTLRTVKVKTKAPVMRFADFDRRRTSGYAGIFLTDSQIVKGGHILLTDLFRRFPSIKVIDSAGTYVVISARALKPVIIPGKSLDLAPCVFRIIVDDMPMPWGFDMDMLNRDEIHGIEVYPGPATIPVEFANMRRESMCGMIIIWTKSR